MHQRSISVGYVAAVRDSDHQPPASTWAPLRSGAFRSLWIAVLASNIGTWMQTVGAQWLLVETHGGSALVALVQTASLLPGLLLALPSGVLADCLDRRRLLISVQGFQLAVGIVLTGLTAAGQMQPALLLTLTFALGVGQTLTIPAWQALIPDLVPRAQLLSAAALGSISINAARAIGPAIAGLLIAHLGVAVVFWLNTVTFLVFAGVLLRWRPGPDLRPGTPERFTAALRAGGRYVRHAPIVRRLLLRAVLFIVPGSALWSLLPLVARNRLGLGSGGYGMLLGALGTGAICAAVVLPRIRRWLGGSSLLLVSGGAFGTALLTLALVRTPVVVALVLVPAGAAWMLVLSSVNAAMQLFLPRWVRARGLSIFQIVVAGGQALGALAFGSLAQATDLVTAHLCAAALMVVGTATLWFWPMRDGAGLNREPAAWWPVPILALDPAPEDGPVLVTVSYRLRPDREAAFIAAMAPVRRSRQRSGASQWGLFRDGERPDQLVEVYLVGSWAEHLRQHQDRLTGADEEYERLAVALTEGEAKVTHLLPATL